MANLLNNKELKEFLNRLEEDDAIKLAVTTTQKLIKQEEIDNKDDAIDLILRHSPDIPTILNRKIIRREILFHYLNEKKVQVIEPTTKLGLINKIIKFWEHGDAQNETDSNKTVATIAPQKETPDEVSQLANKFAEWFYSILNENSPIGEEHFFQDCVLHLNMISDSANVSECVENNPLEIVKLLFKTKCEHGLFFNPNLTSEGIKGKMDSHGLVIVFVCGSLHTKDSIVGVFEQMFALARDPFSENNWKVKNTTLNLRSKAVTNVPILANTSLNYEVALRES